MSSAAILGPQIRKKMIAFHRRIFVILLTITILTICSSLYLLLKFPKVKFSCYHKRGRSLPSILDSKPIKEKSIFFVETSCNPAENNKIEITSRQACAVESAARLNPNFEIYLLYVSPGIIKHGWGKSDRVLQSLLTYKNVKIRHLDVGEYVKDTPVEALWSGGTIEESNFVQAHLSDVLRLVTLWRFGGIYLDLDVVVIKSLENLPLNYAGAEDEGHVGSAVLSFGHSGAGHVFATQCLEDLRDNFNGIRWEDNGPVVITRLAKHLCASDNVSDMFGKTCAQSFRIYPPETFSSVHWQNWTHYFNENFIGEVKDLSRNSYVLHVWNYFSFKEKIPIGAQVPYALFAEQFCPQVYMDCVEFF